MCPLQMCRAPHCAARAPRRSPELRARSCVLLAGEESRCAQQGPRLPLGAASSLPCDRPRSRLLDFVGLGSRELVHYLQVSQCLLPHGIFLWNSVTASPRPTWHRNPGVASPAGGQGSLESEFKPDRGWRSGRSDAH